MDERAALHGLQQRQEPALAWLIDRYTPYVSTIAANIIGPHMSLGDVEEVTADVFFVLWQNADKVRPGKVKAYLSAAARNKAKEKLRALHPELSLEDDVLLIAPDDVERMAAKGEQAAILRRAIDSMPRSDREIFLRRYYYFQPLAQIAREMELNLSTVKTRLRRGRLRLREQLKQEGYDVQD